MAMVTSNDDNWSIMYNDPLTIDEKELPLYLGHSFEIFSIEESNLERDALSAMNGFGTTIVVSSLITSVLVGSYY